MYKIYTSAEIDASFDETFKQILKGELSRFSDKEILGYLIKRLSAADVLEDENKKGNTTHIAYTTKSRYFFKDIIYDILINRPENLIQEDGRTNYKFPIYLVDSRQNGIIETNTVFWVNEKNNNDHQIGLSKESLNGSEFNLLRNRMRTNDFLIFIKIKDQNEEFKLYCLLIDSNNRESKMLSFLKSNYTNRIKFQDTQNNASFIENMDESDSSRPSEIGSNIIIYGAPGTGKSFTLKKKYEKEGYYERVTFHPEYTFHDFIGSIKPKVEDEKIQYKFEPGPFTNILNKAVKDKNKNMYTLIIEEINRANAPAVFGDLFQLLDREEDGTSTYDITNFEIADYIFKDKERKIKLPVNLNIVATMNSADQNVFVMDTAFKRRWDFNYLPIDFSECDYRKKFISELNCTWEQFVNSLNKYLLDLVSEGIEIPEDKLIGPWFVKESQLENYKAFANKVLYYLWDDVLKIDRYLLFNSEIKSLVQLIDGYRDNGVLIFNDKFRGYLEVEVSFNYNEVKEENILGNYAAEDLVRYSSVIEDERIEEE